MSVPAPDSPIDLPALLAAAARGDESAWRELIARYHRRVYAMARSRCRRNDLAEEITQSVFATVAEKLGSGGYKEHGRFESWLFRVTMNRVRDEMARIARHADPTDPVALAQRAAGASDEPAPVDERGLGGLRAALGALGEADREVIELRHHAEMSFRMIAEHLGQPMGTVLARHHRALRKLRDILGGTPAGPVKETTDATDTTDDARGALPRTRTPR